MRVLSIVACCICLAMQLGNSEANAAELVGVKDTSVVCVYDSNDISYWKYDQSNQFTLIGDWRMVGFYVSSRLTQITQGRVNAVLQMQKAKRKGDKISLNIWRSTVYYLDLEAAALRQLALSALARGC